MPSYVDPVHLKEQLDIRQAQLREHEAQVSVRVAMKNGKKKNYFGPSTVAAPASKADSRAWDKKAGNPSADTSTMVMVFGETIGLTVDDRLVATHRQQSDGRDKRKRLNGNAALLFDTVPNGTCAKGSFHFWPLKGGTEVGLGGAGFSVGGVEIGDGGAEICLRPSELYSSDNLSSLTRFSRSRSAHRHLVPRKVRRHL